MQKTDIKIDIEQKSIKVLHSYNMFVRLPDLCNISSKRKLSVLAQRNTFFIKSNEL